MNNIQQIAQELLTPHVPLRTTDEIVHAHDAMVRVITENGFEAFGRLMAKAAMNNLLAELSARRAILMATIPKH